MWIVTFIDVDIWHRTASMKMFYSVTVAEEIFNVKHFKRYYLENAENQRKQCAMTFIEVDILHRIASL